MADALFPDMDALSAICRKYGIRRLALFGSVLTGADVPASDIDLLAEFEPEAKPSLFDMAMIEDALSQLLGGRPVDLRTPEDLSRYFRADVMREAKVQYVAA